MMKNTEIKNIKGETKNLWDAFDDEMEWKTSEFGENKDWTSYDNLDKDGFNTSKLLKFSKDLNTVREATQGDYRHALLGKATHWGRMFHLFRTWLPQAIHQRFGEELIHDNFKGRYRSYGTLWRKTNTIGFVKEILGYGLGTTLVKMLNLPIIGKYLGLRNLADNTKEAYGEHLKSIGLSELDIENMQVNIKEAQFFLSMIILGLALQGLAGGDDDDPELNYLMNITQRLYQDFTMFYNPNSAFNIVKDPIPTWKTIQDFGIIVNDATEVLTNSSKSSFAKGRNKGKNKLMYHLGDFFPGAHAYNSTVSTVSQVFGQNTQQYMKNK